MYVQNRHRYLFNTRGQYIGFVAGDNVFTPQSRWLGFIINGNELFSPQGKFVGYVLDDDRIVRKRDEYPRLPLLPRIPPLPPLPPLPPMPRLPKPPLPHPYEDVYA